MRFSISDGVTATLMLGAIIIGGLSMGKATVQPSGRNPEPRQISGWEELQSEGNVIGPESAPVRIVEFSSFQCTFCADIHPHLAELRARHAGNVAVVYRHLVIESLQPQAFHAALASECAGAQGRFEAYHDVLFEHQAVLDERTWERFAELADVADVNELRRCMAQQQFRDRVERDVNAAKQIGIRGTPTMIVAGRVFAGMSSIPQLREHVNMLVAAHTSSGETESR